MNTFTVGDREMVHGFDWSQWQNPRDLTGILDTQSFSVFKATEGNSFGDPSYFDHVSQANSVGLIHGAYHFARPDWSSRTPYDDGRAEAEWFLSRISFTERFAVLDLEATTLNASQTTEYVRGWNDKIIESNRFPKREQRVTYVGKWFTWAHTGLVEAQSRSVLWIASYTAGYTNNVRPDQISLPAWSSDLWPEGWHIWQYSSSGTIGGIHPSDVNVATANWLAAISNEGSIDRQDFKKQNDGGNPNMWVYWYYEAAFRLVDVPIDEDHPFGQAWRWIENPTVLGDLAFSGKINAAVNITVVDDPKDEWSKSFQALFNRYPIDTAPPNRQDWVRSACG